MAPKYRGDEEDWLDNEDPSGIRTPGTRPKRNQSARSTNLPDDQANATVAEVYPNQCRVRMDLTPKAGDPVENSPGPDQAGPKGQTQTLPRHEEILCSYRRAEVVSKGKSEVRERTPVAVGDRVRANANSQVIEGICKR